MKVDTLGNYLTAHFTTDAVQAATNSMVNETQVIKRLSEEITKIYQETDYIKEYGAKPNTEMPKFDYKKMLDIT